MTVPFSIEMVIWVAVGGRGTLVGAILGSVVIMYAKSLVSEALPETWLFIQGGLFILVVTALPEGVIGWFRGEGPRNVMSRLGFLGRLVLILNLKLMAMRRCSHEPNRFWLQSTSGAQRHHG